MGSMATEEEEKAEVARVMVGAAMGAGEAATAMVDEEKAEVAKAMEEEGKVEMAMATD